MVKSNLSSAHIHNALHEPFSSFLASVTDLVVFVQTDGHEELREVHHKAGRLQQRVYQEAAKLLQNAELAAG